MHILLVATGTSGDAFEVRSFRVRSVPRATKPHPSTASIHYSHSPHFETQHLETTLWDRGRGPTVNQARNESSHNDSPIMSTQQICRHRPFLLLILHKRTLCWPQFRCKQIPIETHFANRSSPSLLPATHLRLRPLRALIIPRRHIRC